MTPVSDVAQMLFDSSTEVLETMFFASVSGDAPPEALQDWIGARLHFHGSPSGNFGVRVTSRSARTIAAGFLGVEDAEVSESQVGEVVCELANMLCGSVLSRFEKDARFDLTHPELSAEPTGEAAVSRTLELEDGAMQVWLEMENPS
jgi:CheY-specific phosphatase CheX